MRDCYNRTLLHMEWVGTLRLGADGLVRRTDSFIDFCQAQYGEFLVKDLKVPVDTQSVPQYALYEGQHPVDPEDNRDEQYEPVFEVWVILCT